MIDKLDGCIFWLKIMTWKNIMLCGIKSALILKNNLIARLSIKNILKTKLKSYGDEVTDFYDKEITKVGSDHTCLAVISLDFLL